MRRTSVMIPEETYRALRRLAEERGGRLSDVVREALGAYVGAAGPRERPFTFIGAGRSGVDGGYSLRLDDAMDELLDEDLRRGHPD